MGSITFDVDRLLNGKLSADELEQIRQLIRQLVIMLPDVKKLISLNRDIIQRYADLSEQARAIFDRLMSFEDRYEEYSGGLIREMDDLTDAVKRIERLVILDKAGLSQSTEAVKIRTDIQADQERDYLTTELITQQKLLQTRNKTLSKQLSQAAQYGSRDFAPIELQAKIEATEADIESSKSTIEHIKAKLRGLWRLTSGDSFWYFLSSHFPIVFIFFTLSYLLA